jgi:hypothetical protein
MKYKVWTKAKNSGKINIKTIYDHRIAKVKFIRQFNSLVTVTFSDSFGEIVYLITNVVEIERTEE